MNPYRHCRRFLQKRGEANVYAYGETPYATYRKLVHECEIGSNDTWFEMGAGRGKGCFWLAHFVKCRVVGIEWIPLFVFIARIVKFLFRMDRIDFQRTDIAKADLSQATVLYLYGSFPNFSIPPGVKVITISEPLENGKVLKSFWVRYPWGRTTAFLQHVVNERGAE